MGFYFTSTVLLLAVALGTAQRTTKKPNIPDFEDRYVSNPFTQEELASLSGAGGGSVGVVPPSDTQGGGGSSGGVFVPPADPTTTTTRRTTTTTEDFSSVFLGNEQQPNNNNNNNNNNQRPSENFNQRPDSRPGRPDSRPGRPGNGNNRPIWNVPTRNNPPRRFIWANRNVDRFNF